MTKALTLDEARELLTRSLTLSDVRFPQQLVDNIEVLIDAKLAERFPPVSPLFARQEIAALSDGEERRIRDLLGDPRVGVSVGAIPETFGVSPALSDGDRTRADDAQVGGATGQTDDKGLAAKLLRCASINEAPGYVHLDVSRLLRDAAAALRSRDATISELRAQLDDDVRRLVIAARAVAFGDADEAAIRELDAASEAFADRIPWDDEPAGRSALSSQSKEG